MHDKLRGKFHPYNAKMTAPKKATADQVVRKLRSLRNEKNLAGMARFGIATDKAFGIKHPILKKIARELGRDTQLAQDLWDSGYHEARLIAPLVADPKTFTEKQADAWVEDINSWDICDGFIGSLVDRSPFAWKKAKQWGKRDEEFVRRAGFALMAWLAVHDKKASNDEFAKLLPLIARYSTDERNYVKKAVNWALRQIGKRNLALNKQAIKAAREIARIDSKSARWIAADALKELSDPARQSKLKDKK